MYIVPKLLSLVNLVIFNVPPLSHSSDGIFSFEMAKG